MKKKVLVVDDDPKIIKLLTFQLTKWGYEVVSSNDGLDCFQLVETENPDLVLLDIMMPGLDGLSVCSEITTSYNLPVIMVSGVPVSKAKGDSEIFGAVEYVKKPINMDELKSKVEQSITQFGKNA